jgi:hypothetical protein
MKLLEKCQCSHLRNMNKYRIPVRQEKANVNFLKWRHKLTELFEKRQI